jgi:putative FmdB family regulatory protein
MPTYEYACRDCGEHLEVVQSFKDDALTDCPACQGSLRKVFSAAGIVFKGSGWHIKDYADAKSPTASNGDSTGGDGSGSSKDAKEVKASKERKPKKAKSSDSASSEKKSA